MNPFDQRRGNASGTHDPPGTPPASRRALRDPTLRLDCLLCPTRLSAEWTVLSDEGMAQVDRAKTSRAYRRGESIHTQGQPGTGLYCIAKGTIAIRRSEPNTAPILLRLGLAGQTFGFRNCLDDFPCVNGAKALSSSQVCHLDKAVLHRLLKRHPALARAFQAHLSTDLNETETALARLAWHPVRMRLVRTLIWLRERFGAVNARGEWEVSLPMTRRDLAELLAARPETLTRTLQAMEQEGLLAHNGSVIIVRHPQRLQREMNSSAP